MDLGPAKIYLTSNHVLENGVYKVSGDFHGIVCYARSFEPPPENENILRNCFEAVPERDLMVSLSNTHLDKSREFFFAAQKRSRCHLKVAMFTEPFVPLGLSSHLEIMPIDTKATKVADSAGMTEGPRISLVMQTSVGIGTPMPTAGQHQDSRNPRAVTAAAASSTQSAVFLYRCR